MPQALLDERRVSARALFGLTAGVDRHAVFETDRGTKVVQGVAIFRSGSFKDSEGEQRTWTDEQLAMMVSNFGILRDGDLLPNVPVRTDHSWSVEGVIGYIAALSVSNGLLLADIEFTEPTAYEKFDRGTYRSRSLEVGMYETNDGVVFWPVVMGLAFVDIPAVEGLHRGAQKVGCYRYQGDELVPDNATEQKPAAPTFKFRIGGNETTDFSKVQAHVDALEGENTGLKTQVETLNAFVADTKKAARHDFVKGLAEGNKIAATQIEGLSGLAEGLSDEQWDAFKATYEKAPAVPILGAHTETVSNPDNSTERPGATELDILNEKVAQFRLAGLTEEAIAKTDTGRRLVALNGSK